MNGIWLPVIAAAACALIAAWALWPLRPRRGTCSCGHLSEAHGHYRAGTECSLCPEGECGRFRAGRARTVDRQLALGLLGDAMGRAEELSDENEPGGTR